MRIHVGVAEKAPVVRLQLNQFARRQRRQRRACDVDLIAEHPEVSGREPAFLATLQTQQGQGRSGNLRGLGVHRPSGLSGRGQ